MGDFGWLAEWDLGQPSGASVPNLLAKKHPLPGAHSPIAKVVHSDRQGPIVSPEIMKNCQDALDFGVETVAFTFVVFKLKRGWASIINATVAATAVEELRAELKPTGVKFTQQIDDVLAQFERGEMLPEAVEARRAAVPSAGSAVAAPTASTATSAQGALGMSGRSTAASPARSDLHVAEGSTDASGAKRSMSDRLAAFKRRRTT